MPLATVQMTCQVMWIRTPESCWQPEQRTSVGDWVPTSASARALLKTLLKQRGVSLHPHIEISPAALPLQYFTCLVRSSRLPLQSPDQQVEPRRRAALALSEHPVHGTITG